MENALPLITMQSTRTNAYKNFFVSKIAISYVHFISLRKQPVLFFFISPSLLFIPYLANLSTLLDGRKTNKALK